MFTPHYFTAERVFTLNGKAGVGSVSDGPVESLEDAVVMLLESIDQAERSFVPSTSTIRVMEIDGSVALDRTQDALELIEWGAQL